MFSFDHWPTPFWAPLGTTLLLQYSISGRPASLGKAVSSASSILQTYWVCQDSKGLTTSPRAISQGAFADEEVRQPLCLDREQARLLLAAEAENSPGPELLSGGANSLPPGLPPGPWDFMARPRMPV